MFTIRKTKTASGATAIQIVRYEQRKKIIVKHIGSAHTANELASLREIAEAWIEKETAQPSLFPKPKERLPTLIPIDKCQYLGFRYTYLYEVLHEVFCRFGWDGLDRLLLDLVLMRIVQPASKLESLDLLSDYFGKTYRRANLYRHIPVFVSLKESIEQSLVSFAQDHLQFDCSFVFYDVTTLYFETHQEDEDTLQGKGLRQAGFSKDNKSSQPQIVIGLMVTREGFPVAYEVFEGDTFEGNTFLPMIRRFKKTYDIKTLTVVADAAMLSLSNIQQLIEHRLRYIVGARIANLKLPEIEQISMALRGSDLDLKTLEKREGSSFRIQTDRGLLLCDFSLKRFRKDQREMNKQIAKAQELLQHHQGLKRAKFIKTTGSTQPILHQELIDKTRLLLGIKGYYTNLTEIDDATIISHYHSLWHVEQAFRIAKSDLAMRPIFHFKKPTIQAHLLICFMALAVCRYMELKTGKSTKKMVKLLKSVTDARLLNLLTNKEIILRSKVSDQLQRLIDSLWY
jgi:transposase